MTNGKMKLAEPPSLEADRLISIKRGAEVLNVSRGNVYNLMDRGGLPYVRIGGRRMLRMSTLDNFVRENTVCA